MALPRPSPRFFKIMLGVILRFFVANLVECPIRLPGSDRFPAAQSL